MGCGCENNSATVNTGFTPMVKVTPPANCMIDQAMLQNWKAKLECVMNNNLLDAISIDTVSWNRLYGVVQSALNWTSNYCYFEYHLQEVLLLMPKIIATGQCNAT